MGRLGQTSVSKRRVLRVVNTSAASRKSRSGNFTSRVSAPSPARLMDDDSGFEGDSMDAVESPRSSVTQYIGATALLSLSGDGSFRASNATPSEKMSSSVKRKLITTASEEDTGGLPDCSKLLFFRNVPLHTLGSSTVSSSSQSTTATIVCMDQCTAAALKVKTMTKESQISLSTPLPSVSSDGSITLKLLSQPETQHRARYLTEGSRGAVKDRGGDGFPIVQLVGYNKPTTLQVFVGSDGPKVAPHLFYQASKVCGKNSTPCKEIKISGTVVIEIPLELSNDMTVTCDCVGILKERNVDVEHRCREQMTATRGRKKSTMCRFVFRASVVTSSGKAEVLQVASNTISCTQPKGVPEICCMSFNSCSVKGYKDLFIIGKNFLKDAMVHFERPEEGWEEIVEPDKEYFSDNHLICKVPSYKEQNISESITVKVCVTSGGKISDSRSLTYEPIDTKNERKLEVVLSSPEKEGFLSTNNRQETYSDIQFTSAFANNVISQSINNADLTSDFGNQQNVEPKLGTNMIPQTLVNSPNELNLQHTSSLLCGTSIKFEEKPHFDVLNNFRIEDKTNFAVSNDINNDLVQRTGPNTLMLSQVPNTCPDSTPKLNLQETKVNADRPYINQMSYPVFVNSYTLDNNCVLRNNCSDPLLSQSGVNFIKSTNLNIAEPITASSTFLDSAILNDWGTNKTSMRSLPAASDLNLQFQNVDQNSDLDHLVYGLEDHSAM